MSKSKVQNLSTLISYRAYYVTDPVKITRLSPSSESFVGQTLMFNCFSDGNPKPTYYWLTPNRRGKYDVTFNDDSSTLRIKLNNSADFGNYTCLVNNSISSDNRNTFLNQLCKYSYILLIDYFNKYRIRHFPHMTL